MKKVCADCKYSFGILALHCKYSRTRDDIYGRYYYYFCSTEREFGRCGLAGKNFEPKISLLQKIINKFKG